MTPWRRLLLAANVVAVVLLFVLAVAYVPGDDVGVVEPSASPSATPRDLMAMGAAHIPTSNSCLLCHVSGGEAGLKPVPALGHQVEGWTACLVCHTNEELGRKAPGHTGIDEYECLNCHKEAPIGPAITQAHAQLAQPCLDCHGEFSHLPSSMVGRNQDECWLCHQARPEPIPQKPHVYDGRLACRSCHQSPEVGALPINHALRSEAICLLCHDIKFMPAPAGPTLPAPVAPDEG
jgi:hypothetical protein